MNEVYDTLIAAKKEGLFLPTLSMLLKSAYDAKTIADTIVQIHNNQITDVLSELMATTSENISKDDYFLILGMLTLAIPHFETKVEIMMACVKHLVRYTMGKLAPEATLSSMIDFYLSKPSQLVEAMALILNAPQQWHEFLSPALVAGTHLDLIHYFNQALQLKNHEDVDIRKRTLFALGMMHYAGNTEILNQAYSTLRQIADTENDNPLLAITLRSVLHLYQNNPSLVEESHIANIINLIFSKGKEYTLQVFSEWLITTKNRLPPPFLDVFLSHIKKMTVCNTNTLKNIDRYIVKSLQKEENGNVLQFLETVILSNHFSLTLFESTAYELYHNHLDLLNQLATRWLRRGEPTLCLAIEHILCAFSDSEQNLYLTSVSEELAGCQKNEFVFFIRKAIGYLFYHPIAVTSLIVSLLEMTDEETTALIAPFLFDPLLVNYPGKVQSFLQEMQNKKTGSVRTLIQHALEKSDAYFEDINASGKIPELLPSEFHRAAHYKFLNQQITAAWMNRPKSVFELSAKKITLLYGRKFIYYQQGLGGRISRAEAPLQQHRFFQERPRLERLSPFELEQMLIIFRSEELTI